MAAAKKGVVCILVDCNWGKANQELSKKYRVRGYPTIIFVDAEGKLIERGSRKAETLAGQFKKHAETKKG